MTQIYGVPWRPRGAYDRVRYRARRAEGSCKSCGHESQPGRTRCFDCARRDAEYARGRKRRAVAR